MRAREKRVVMGRRVARVIKLTVLGSFIAHGFLLWATAPTPARYEPDPKQWRMEVAPDLGGWITEAKQQLRIKIVDPKDPDPPKEQSERRIYDDYEGEGEGEGEHHEKTADELKAERLKAEEETARNQWRSRQITVWFNGTTIPLSVQVGYSTTMEIKSQNGENRLELCEPTSGLRVARSWWVSTSKIRLHIAKLPDQNWNGNLEILEPNGELATSGKRTVSGGVLNYSGEYTHPTPAPGTYALRWTGGYRGGKPSSVCVEAVLDGGTDTERRWHFERLILPGAGPVTLGTVDVEN